MLQGRMSKKWEEAHESHTTQQKESNKDGKTTPISSLMRQLWRVAEVLWKTRNKNKHWANPKKREDAEKDRLSPQIKKTYRDQYISMTPQSRRQHFGVKLANRLAYIPQQNKRWLEGV